MTYLDALMREPWAHDFFDMMRHVERSLGASLGSFAPRPRLGDSASRHQEILRLTATSFDIEAPLSFGQDPWMAFPGATLRNVSVRSDTPIDMRANAALADAAPPHRLHIVSAFLGLLGAQGPLPLHLTEEAQGWMKTGDFAFAHFLDIFNNRFIQLFYRAAADSRPIFQADRDDCDRFRAYVLSTLGVGSHAFDTCDDASASDAATTDSARIPAGIGLYAGLLGPAAKCASRLRGAIRGLLRIDAEIEEFVGGWLMFEDSERSLLGGRNSRLGSDFLLGAASFSVQDKIRIRLFARDLTHYERFLPASADCARLVDLLFFYIGDELEWDVELALPAKHVPPLRLVKTHTDGDGGAQLGWTSWLVNRSLCHRADGWRRDARFRPAERQRQERDMNRRAAESAKI